MNRRQRAAAHREAYCCLTYRCQEHRSQEERIWNSRDGEVALVITMRCGHSGHHVSWNVSSFDPEHQPQVGERIFVDLTSERARIQAMQTAAKWWNEGGTIGAEARRVYSSELELIAALYAEAAIEIASGAPDLVVVTEEMARARGWVQQGQVAS